MQAQRQQKTLNNNIFLVWQIGRQKNEAFRKTRNRNLLLRRYGS